MEKVKADKKDKKAKIEEIDPAEQRYAIWIVPQGDEDEEEDNDFYLETLKPYLPNFTIMKVNTVDEAFKTLSKKEYQFQLIYILLDPSVVDEWMKKYEEKITKLNLTTANMIFAHEEQYLTKYKKDKFYKSKFLLPGKVEILLENIRDYLKSNQRVDRTAIIKSHSTYGKGTEQYANKGKTYGHIFKKVSTLSEIAFPLLFASKLIQNQVFTQEDYDKFAKFIFKYGRNK